MAFGSQPPQPPPTIPPAPTMEGFAFSQIGKEPSLLSRFGPPAAIGGANASGQDSSPSLDFISRADPNDEDDDMYVPLSAPEASTGDVDMQDVSANSNATIAFASNPGATSSRSLFSRLNIHTPPAATAHGNQGSNPTLPAAVTQGTLSTSPIPTQVASTGATAPREVIPGPPAPANASQPLGISTPAITTPAPDAQTLDKADFAAVRALFSSLSSFKIPVPEGIAQLVHTLTTETASTSASANKAVESAQEALKWAQSYLQAAQTSLESANSLEVKCREVTQALERLSKESALKKQSWDKTMKETVDKGEEWVLAKEKEMDTLRKDQERLRDHNKKLADAARHFKNIATKQTPTSNAPTDPSFIHYPGDMPVAVREKIDAYAKQQLQTYQEEEQAKLLEKERECEELLRRHQEEIDRLASERERLRKEREEAQLRMSRQARSEPPAKREEQGLEQRALQAQQPSAYASGAEKGLNKQQVDGDLQRLEFLTHRTQRKVASASTAGQSVASPGQIPAIPQAPKMVSSTSNPRLHEAALREKLKVRVNQGCDRHDNKSMTTSPISATGLSLSQPNSAHGSPLPDGQVKQSANTPNGLNDTTGNALHHAPVIPSGAPPSIPHRPLPSSLPTKPQASIRPSAQYKASPGHGMPTPLPSPNALSDGGCPQPPSPVDHAPHKPLSKRQAKKMRKASQQGAESDSSQMTINHHGRDAGNLFVGPSPTSPTVALIQEMNARRSSAECFKERTQAQGQGVDVEMKSEIKEEPVDTALPRATAPDSKVKAEAKEPTIPIAVQNSSTSDQFQPELPVSQANMPRGTAGSSSDPPPLPVRPAKRKQPVQDQLQVMGSISVNHPVSYVGNTSGHPDPPALSTKQPAPPPPPSGQVATPSDQRQFNPKSNTQPMGRNPPVSTRPSESGRPPSRGAHRGAQTWGSTRRSPRSLSPPPRSADPYPRGRLPFGDHYSPPPFARYYSPPPNYRRRPRSPPPPPSSAPLSNPRKRPLDSAPIPEARRYRHDPGMGGSQTSNSNSSLATMGEHEIDMHNLPLRPPLRKPRSRVPSVEPRGGRNPGEYGASSGAKPSLETRIEQYEQPRPARDFSDRLADPPLAEPMFQEPPLFRPRSPVSDNGDKAPLSSRLSNPSYRGRGRARGRGGAGRGGKPLLGRISDAQTENYDNERD